MGPEFYIKSTLFGVALAMDAFSVSLANGLNEPCMKKRKMVGIAGIFAFFQALMPMLGWFCVHTVVKYFEVAEKFVPWIALALLGYIGGKMLVEGIRNNEVEVGCCCGVGLWCLIVQGVATSIDALSVGFDIENYDLIPALICAGIIAAVTFVICLFGVILGRKTGTRLAGKAGILGGSILIFIGLEIFITSWL